MEKHTRLEAKGLDFGFYGIKVYDGCKDRKAALTIADELLKCITSAGGAVEDIEANGGNRENVLTAIAEINKARYMARLLDDNKLCAKRALTNFLSAADSLHAEVVKKMPVEEEPEPAQPVQPVQYVQPEPVQPEQPVQYVQPEPIQPEPAVAEPKPEPAPVVVEHKPEPVQEQPVQYVEEVIEPEPEKPKKKKVKRVIIDDYDPDGFDDPV